MRNDEGQVRTTIERDRVEIEGIERESEEMAGLDFFSDAPLDVESAVTGKACNIFDPDCEACQ